MTGGVKEVSGAGGLLYVSPERIVNAFNKAGWEIYVNSSFKKIALRTIKEMDRMPVEFYADINSDGISSHSSYGTIGVFLDYDPIKDNKLFDVFSFLNHWSTELSQKIGDVQINNPLQNLIGRGFRIGVNYSLNEPLDVERDTQSLIHRVNSQEYNLAMSNSPERDMEIIQGIKEAGTRRDNI